jgi:hypothetical protein
MANNVVILYDSFVREQKSPVETIVPTLGKDGNGVGYFISNAETPAANRCGVSPLVADWVCRPPGTGRRSTLHRLHARKKDAWATKYAADRELK